MTDLDLTRYVRPGDRVVWGQGPAEPPTLTELLVAQRNRLGGVTCFVGLPGPDVIRPEHADVLTFESYCGYVGSVGGASDFLRGAARSPGGVPIVALPSTAGAASRIVARLDGPVSTARSDAGVIVTEHGVADLRGAPVSVRYEQMLAVAHPEHRAALAAELEEHLMNGVLR
jgi:hypothetical protein